MTAVRSAIEVTHRLGSEVAVSHGGGELLRYVYGADDAVVEAPKPYVHPLRTLAGNCVSIFRPHDHLWHKGLAMGWAHVSGQNFWGGPTYVRDKGYTQLENNGRLKHREWAGMDVNGDNAELRERLTWITHAGEPWIDEARTLAVSEITPAEGHWALDFAVALTNVSQRTLVFGSPTTEGRRLSGYGGLVWRGPRSFTGGTILAAGGLSGPEVMGKSAPWLAFVGHQDGSGDDSTLVFLDHPSNERYPNKWFVRNVPYGCVGFGFAFDEERELAVGQMLPLRYRILVADGAWDAHRAESYAQRWIGRTPER